MDMQVRSLSPPPDLRRVAIIGSRPDLKSGAPARGLGVQVPHSPPI